MRSIWRHKRGSGIQSARRKRRGLAARRKYAVNATQPTAMAMKEASAAPATPIGCPVAHPNRSVGASTTLRTTVPTWMAVGIFTSPVPRRAAPMATRGNWRNSAGTNQFRYWMPSAAVIASAASQRQ